MTQISRPFQAAITAMVVAQIPDIPLHYGGVQVPDDELTYPYVVQWPVPAEGYIANLAGNLIPRVNDVKFVYCGRDSDEVLWGLDEIHTALHGQRPVIEGWNSHQIRQVPMGNAVEENASALFEGRPTWRGWAHYRMHTSPATAASASS